MTTWVLSTVGMSMVNNWKDSKGLPRNSEDIPTNEELDSYLNSDLGEAVEQQRTLDKAHSAEIQTLWLLFKDWRKKEPNVRHSVHLALFPTSGSRTCALAIARFIQDGANRIKLSQVFPDVVFEDFDEGTDLRVCDIDPKPEFFSHGIAKLAQEMRHYINEKSVKRGTFYVDPTGGFKATWMLWPLVGALYQDAIFIYAHEKETSLVQLPRFPLGADLGMLEELHSFLQGDGISQDVYDILPPQAQSLFYRTSQDRCKPNFFGEMFSDLYAGRTTALSGSGSILLRQIGSLGLHSSLEHYIPKWQDVWMGDQLPETVEHGKPHSLRLMEFTVQALPSLNVTAIGGEAGLFLLFASLWLHDIGHTEISFKAVTDGGLIRDIPIDRFPSLVRDWHAESSSRLINTDDSYLTSRDGQELVAMICRYHRQKMPLRGKVEDTATEGGTKICPRPDISLEATASGFLHSTKRLHLRDELQGLTSDNVVAIAALLRFLDATDVQAARTSDTSYAKSRARRTNYEVDCLMGRLKDICARCKVQWNGLVTLSEEVQQDMAFWESVDMNPSDNCGRGLPSMLLKLDEAIGSHEEMTLAMATAVLGFGDKYVAETSKLSEEQRIVALEELSLLDRILFKYRQHIHFQKHASVEYCWYWPSDKGLRVYLRPSFGGECFAEKIANNIRDEVSVMRGELQNVLPFDDVYIAAAEKDSTDEAGTRS